MIEQINMDFDDWEAKFFPLWDENSDGTPIRIEPQEWDKMKEHTPMLVTQLRPFLWTEFDDHNLASGEHFVNRYSFWLCANPTPSDSFIFVNYDEPQEEEDDE